MKKSVQNQKHADSPKTGASAFAFPATVSLPVLERDFRQTRFGSTNPRHGFIDGRHYIAKCGHWSQFSSDEHVANEVVADGIIRGMGFLVPASRLYRVRAGGRNAAVRLAEFLEGARPLGEAWRNGTPIVTRGIVRQTIAAYPLLHLLDANDTFDGGGLDNVLVDEKGRMWFVDNGCSFNFRARGMRKQYDVFSRRNPRDAAHGFFSMRDFPRQYLLRQILSGVSERRLWATAAKFDVARFVALLPRCGYHIPALRSYAEAMVETAISIVS